MDQKKGNFWPRTVQISLPSKEKTNFYFCEKTVYKKEYERALLRNVNKNVYPAKIFPFCLDTFQKIAIHSIEQGIDLFVSAHTSSGKTVIAEYAIAKSISKGKKAIYTCPVKALSNQKFRDLSNIFDKCGLMTGDMTINPSGNCLVMTTEILRSFLFENSLEVFEIEWVIIDETHYIGDIGRGFVWEEIFMFLPKSVHLVCLSATMPNVQEFGEWLVNVRESNLCIIETKNRPIVLSHYVYSYFDQSLTLVSMENPLIDQKKSLRRKIKNEKSHKKKDELTRSYSGIKILVQKIYKNKFDPVIIFTFSKRKCQKMALFLKNEVFCTKKESVLIEKFFKKIGEIIPDKNSIFSQCAYLLVLIKNGIGIHHAGLSSTLREIIEILFQANLIKILFATETFSVGLNMPARTVIFSSLTKFDGRSLRTLNKGEFIQMSGRAGRRGIDEKGVVITLADSLKSLSEIEKILYQKIEPILSMYRLTIDSFLKLSHNFCTNISPVLKRSFFFYQNKISKVRYIKFRKKIKTRINLQLFPNEKFFRKCSKLTRILGTILEYLETTTFFTQICKKYKFLKEQKKHKKRESFKKKKFFSSTFDTYTNFILFINSLFLRKKNRHWVNKILLEKNMSETFVLFFNLLDLKLFQTDFMEISGIFSNNSLFLAVLTLKLINSFLGIYFNMGKKISTFISYLSLFLKRRNPGIITFSQRSVLGFGTEKLLISEHEKIKIILKNLKLLHSDESLTKKGHLCCKLNSDEAILCVELMYKGSFNKLPFEMIIAFLGGFISNEMTNKEKLHPELLFAFKRFQKEFSKIFKICKGSVLSVKLIQNMGPMKIGIINILFAWCKGIHIGEIQKMGWASGGFFDKCIKQICDTLRQLSRIYEELGDINLAFKFENCFSEIQNKLKVQKILTI